MEKNRSGRTGKKIKTLIIVKGNLKKVNFVTFHIIFKHKLFVIDKILLEMITKYFPQRNACKYPSGADLPTGHCACQWFGTRSVAAL